MKEEYVSKNTLARFEQQRVERGKRMIQGGSARAVVPDEDQTVTNRDGTVIYSRGIGSQDNNALVVRWRWVDKQKEVSDWPGTDRVYAEDMLWDLKRHENLIPQKGVEIEMWRQTSCGSRPECLGLVRGCHFMRLRQATGGPGTIAALTAAAKAQNFDWAMKRYVGLRRDQCESKCELSFNCAGIALKDNSSTGGLGGAPGSATGGAPPKLTANTNDKSATPGKSLEQAHTFSQNAEQLARIAFQKPEKGTVQKVVDAAAQATAAVKESRTMLADVERQLEEEKKKRIAAEGLAMTRGSNGKSFAEGGDSLSQKAVLSLGAVPSSKMDTLQSILNRRLCPGGNEHCRVSIRTAQSPVSGTMLGNGPMSFLGGAGGMGGWGPPPGGVGGGPPGNPPMRMMGPYGGQPPQSLMTWGTPTGAPMPQPFYAYNPQYAPYNFLQTGRTGRTGTGRTGSAAEEATKLAAGVQGEAKRVLGVWTSVVDALTNGVEGLLGTDEEKKKQEQEREQERERERRAALYQAGEGAELENANAGGFVQQRMMRAPFGSMGGLLGAASVQPVPEQPADSVEVMVETDEKSKPVASDQLKKLGQDISKEVGVHVRPTVRAAEGAPDSNAEDNASGRGSASPRKVEQSGTGGSGSTSEDQQSSSSAGGSAGAPAEAADPNLNLIVTVETSDGGSLPVSEEELAAIAKEAGLTEKPKIMLQQTPQELLPQGPPADHDVNAPKEPSGGTSPQAFAERTSSSSQKPCLCCNKVKHLGLWGKAP